MVITYYGLTCFKIEVRGKTLATNPFSKTSGLSAPRFETHVVLSTNPHYHQQTLPGNPYLVRGAGEYDIADMAVEGVQLTNAHVVYVIAWDNLRLLHLGEFSKKEENLDTFLKGIVDTIDILFLPVSGTLTPKEAVAIVQTIDPRIIIPMHYALKGCEQNLGKLKDFLKVFDLKPREESRLSLKRKDLPEEKQELIVLSSPYGVL